MLRFIIIAVIFFKQRRFKQLSAKDAVWRFGSFPPRRFIILSLLYQVKFEAARWYQQRINANCHHLREAAAAVAR